jgi:hypothetical protein
LADLSELTDKNMTMELNGANVLQNATHVGSVFVTSAEVESSSLLGLYSAMALPNHDDMARPPNQDKSQTQKYDPAKNRPNRHPRKKSVK